MNGITFETLAAAYLKKGTPGTHARHTTSRQNKPQKDQATNSTTAAEKAAEIENTQPAEPQPIKLESDFFTAAELAALDRGEQILKKVDSYNTAYFATPYTARTKLIFNLSSYRGEIPAGTNATYTGFLLEGKAYTDAAKLQTALEDEIESQIEKRIPDLNTAIKGTDPERIKFYLEYDYTVDAATQYYYQGKEPQLKLYTTYSQKHTAGELIRWMEDRETFTAAQAAAYIEHSGQTIAEIYVRYDGRKKALESIRADENHPARQIKKLRDSVNDEKTVKVELTNGATVKVDTKAIRYMGNDGEISNWYVIAADRGKLPKDQYNRPRNIKISEVKAIYHGQRTLYQA
jgi:uncharacterized ubiquitin-like protein YukD